MDTFLQAGLAFLAFCVVLGLAAPFALAAKNRKPVLAVLALLAAGFALAVLIMSAVKL